MENNDVDLDSILSEAEGDGASVASDANTNPLTASEGVKTQEDGSSRANERIRELVESNKSLQADVDALKSFTAEQFKKTGSSPSSSELDEYLADVPDEQSREVLKKYGEGLRKQMDKDFSSTREEVRSIKFESEFNSLIQNFPSLKGHKDSLRESYLKNPNLKAVVGELLVDTQLNRVKPIESSKSTVNREAPDIENLSKDELYDLLESNGKR